LSVSGLNFNKPTSKGAANELPAVETILALYKRAQAVGATDLNHYVFPACENDKIAPLGPKRLGGRHGEG